MLQEISPSLPSCASCSPEDVQLSFLGRYRGFLLSLNTLVTIANGVLLIAGIVANQVFHAVLLGNILWIAATLVGGSPIFLLAVRGILKRDLTAGVMVSVAMIAALLIGEYSAAALVAFMMMFGEMLENFTMARADEALKQLARLIPAQATILRGGQPVVVPIEQVQRGDVVVSANGQRIPVDGAVVEGHAAVDESTITGESVPVDKNPNDLVYAGTLNTAGVLQIAARKLGQDTTLGTIVKLVAEAQKHQAPVQRLANRYAQYLVPITFAIAVLVFLATGEIVRSVTVLVVVCPCALVLATPTALAAAIGNAARNNTVVKSGAAMETLAKIDVVAFDKTGTLTVGRPRVVDVVPLDSRSDRVVLSYAASAEKFSEHPLGRAIFDEAIRQGVSIPDSHATEVVTGLGVRAMSGGRQITVGSQRFLSEMGLSLSDEHIAHALALEQQGRTVVPVVLDGQAVGFIALADVVRPEATGMISDLKAAGVKRTVLISGDNMAAVRSVAGQLGIDEYHAEVLPKQKLDLIRGLQAQGHGVAYVGDGVNDAPALAVADVGIAMGGVGTDSAIETAKIVLLTDDMRNLPHLLALSRQTLKTIRIDVAFSMSMNVLALVLSILGVIGPAAGAMMHELSALPVLAYSARLVAFRRQDTERTSIG